MTGFLRSIGYIGDEPTTVRAATVEAPAAYRDATATEVPPFTSGSLSGDGSDAEPTTTELEVAFLRAGVQHHEVQRDLWLSALIFAEAALTKHRRVWDPA